MKLCRVNSIEVFSYSDKKIVHDLTVEPGNTFQVSGLTVSNSGGLHGVGASVVNALCTEMDVVVWRDGCEWHRKYDNATPTKKALDNAGKCGKKTGTKVTFKPDMEIFKHCEFDKAVVQRRLRELSFLNSGVKFTLFWEKEGTTDTYISSDGLIGYVNYLMKKHTQLHAPVRFYCENVEGTEVDVVFAYDDKYDSQIHTFANNIATQEGGVHFHAALDSLSKSIEEHADQKLKSLSLGVNKSDVVEGLTLIISVRVPDPKFGGQTKTRLNNNEIRWPVGNWIKKQMDALLAKDKKLASIIVDKIIDAIKARDASRKAKEVQRKKSVMEMSALTGKLKDCSSKNAELCEIFIVEGDSAGGCLHPDSKVITRDGVKRIADIKIGEFVLAHDGSYRKVTNTWITNKKKKVVLKAGNVLLPVCSHDHPWLIKRGEKLLWVSAEEITFGDMLAKMGEK